MIRNGFDYNWPLEKEKILNRKSWLKETAALLEVNKDQLMILLYNFFGMVERTNSQPKYPQGIKPRFIDWAFKQQALK